MTPNPILALGVFFGLVAAGYLIFRLIQSGILFKKQYESHSQKTDVEDILKQLYHVEYSGKKATLQAMAGALNISDKKLIELIEYMSASDLIQVSENQIMLTEEGRSYALKIIRIHRLWEKYLSEKTGIHKSEWHKRAEKMEHTMTPDEAEELYQALGNPRYDPHGDPIPLKSGEIIKVNNVPLCSLQTGSTARITHIEDEPEAIYDQIIRQKLHIGQEVKILQSDDYQVAFSSEGHDYKLSNIIASNIGVRPLLDEEVFEEQHVRLSALRKGEKARVIGISRECRGASRRRLLDFGFINGTEIEAALNGPTNEPKAYLIRNTLIALRSDQADLILIEKVA